ncbi:hypothetical protein V2647_03775 [Tenacibaculum maritimum]|uniref:hypothetical protein n=1 Tax=Tenacibaculum maritimum TaxID=107401 RepID=UPI001330DABA|nr:hypothetical protein [Tenacibaculum maritimum]
MEPVQQLRNSHKQLLIVAMAYKAAVLDKISEPSKAKLQMDEIIGEAIKAEKSIARTTDF